jgi:hypothetical protein
MVDRAFINTCLRLDNAVRILKSFAKQRVSPSVLPADDLPRDVSKMATKVFQGLRAVYAVSYPRNHGIAVLLLQVLFLFLFLVVVLYLFKFYCFICQFFFYQGTNFLQHLSYHFLIRFLNHSMTFRFGIQPAEENKNVTETLSLGWMFSESLPSNL